MWEIEGSRTNQILDFDQSALLEQFDFFDELSLRRIELRSGRLRIAISIIGFFCLRSVCQERTAAALPVNKHVACQVCPPYQAGWPNVHHGEPKKINEEHV